MSFRTEHELHRRRRGRNVGLALTLAAFIAVIFGLTMVKVTRGDFALPQNTAGAPATEDVN
ncbi:hypothetical protein [Roseivivax isoporae]|uniref:Cytochrome C oxidase assembly protein n=1 Tax=Roseivivax isoporae LMG 25204 TaxID=1449351 RepID=X7FG43_9RHOB|nr:hypothetical protein [Roseivivax isoporae]ETX30974.1 cytochrome C oxidase assembly protein [Roseivivax isoporae LMG 25204]